VICVKGIKIILPFASSWPCEYGFSVLTEIKSKKRETSWHLQQNAGVLSNDGTSFQPYFFPKTGTPQLINFLKQLCFAVSVLRNVFYFLSAPQAEKV